MIRMGISITGLTSGLDTAQMVIDLMAVEKIPYTNLETKKTDLQTEQGVFRAINTKFKSLEAALNTLKLGSDYSKLKATSTGTSVSATAASNAVAGSYNINVTLLAQKQIEGMSDLTDDKIDITNATFNINGEAIKISDLGEFEKNEDALKALVTEINSNTEKYGGKASLIDASGKGNYTLSVVANETGIANAKAAFSFSDATGTTTLKNSSELQKAEDAIFTIDGVAVTRSTNKIDDDLIDGVTFNLTGTGSSTVEVAADTATLVNNIKIFVTAYNDLITLVKDNLSKPANKDQVNPLQGNSLLKQISNDLYNMFNEGVIAGADGKSTFMQDLGLSIDKGAKSASEMTGKITFNEAAFTAAFTADPNKVISVFTNDKDATATNWQGNSVKNAGIITKLSGIMNQYTSTVNGMLTSKITGYDSEIKVVDDRMEAMNRSLEMKEARLKQQFSNMEVLLSSLKSEQNWLTSQFQALLKSNS